VRALPAIVGAVGVLALAGCPGEDPKNAPTVWLAPDGSEIRVKLQEEEPPPW
jgi:hypothetical protein